MVSPTAPPQIKEADSPHKYARRISPLLEKKQRMINFVSLYLSQLLSSASERSISFLFHAHRVKRLSMAVTQMAVNIRRIVEQKHLSNSLARRD